MSTQKANEFSQEILNKKVTNYDQLIVFGLFIVCCLLSFAKEPAIVNDVVKVIIP